MLALCANDGTGIRMRLSAVEEFPFSFTRINEIRWGGGNV